MAILNNLIVKGDTRFIGEAGGDFIGTFNGFDLQMAAPADVNGENGSEGLISSTDKRDLDKLIARVAGFATTAGTTDSNSRCTAYTATISGIGTTLTAGTVIYIKVHANSAEDPTLNVNGTGAKPIYWRIWKMPNDKLIKDNIFMLIYDGTNWIIPYNYDAYVYNPVLLGFGYGTCSTPKDTAAKTVAIGGYNLTVGGMVAIKFTNGSNVANPTLNINSRGDKNIYHNGAAITLTNDYFIAGLIYLFVYDGTQYQLIGDINTDSDHQVTNTVNTTTKAYVTGTTSADTNTGTQIFDTGVYVGTTAGELNSKTYKLNEAVTFEYNSTNQCVDFIFA